MNRSDYTQAVWEIVQDLKDFKEQAGDRFIYSNIVDEEGHQYIDLVQEGGGVLGLALVGFTYVLEELGFRFLSLAGTSAGAINTLLMASLREKEEEGRGTLTRSEQILEKLAEIDFIEFVDGGNDAIQLTEAITSKNPWNRLTTYTAGLRNMDEFLSELGINPGEKFQDWLNTNVPHKSTRSLLDNMNHHPPLFRINWKKGDKELIEDPGITLAIVAADITTQSKVVFPEMADLFYLDHQAVNPVNFVRASMSVPLFFKPFRISLKELLTEVSEDGLRVRWKRKLGYEGRIPPEVLLVDGGIMSNFPIDTLYFPDRILQRPIVGIKLGIDRDKYFQSKNILNFLNNNLEGARNIRDFEYLFGNPIFKDLVSYVDVSGFNWLNFRLSDKEKIDLFIRGAKAAKEFIHRFDWPVYQKKVRSSQLETVRKMNSGLLHYNDIKYKLGFNDRIQKRIENGLKNKTRRQILWIDDDYTNDSLELIVLERINMEVTLASSSHEARKILHARTQAGRHPAFDLIITDTNRGGEAEEGIRFCTELCKHELYGTIPVLLHSKTWKEVLQAKEVKLPNNIRRSKKNLLLLNELIEEVVDILG